MAIRLYSYFDANGVKQYIHAPEGESHRIYEVVRNQLNGNTVSHVGTFEPEQWEEELRDDSPKPWANSRSILDISNVGGDDGRELFSGAAGDTQSTFADIAGMAPTLRNFLQGMGIAGGGAIGRQAQNMLLPGAGAALGFGQLMDPANAENINLTNLLRSGGLSGLATTAREVFNKLAASGTAIDPSSLNQEGTFQNPNTEGSELAANTRNLALSAMFERSPFAAAMFGNDMINRGSERYFDARRAAQAPGAAEMANPNMANFLQSVIGKNLFQRSPIT